MMAHEVYDRDELLAGGELIEGNDLYPTDEPLFLSQQPPDVDFDDPKIASLPRLLMMGPRRSGKTSIQVSLLVCYAQK